MIQDPGGAPILKSDTVKAFEAHVLRHSAIYPTNSSGDPDFTGQEDFNLLYTAVANLSSHQAQKEGFIFNELLDCVLYLYFPPISLVFIYAISHLLFPSL